MSCALYVRNNSISLIQEVANRKRKCAIFLHTDKTAQVWAAQALAAIGQALGELEEARQNLEKGQTVPIALRLAEAACKDD